MDSRTIHIQEEEHVEIANAIATIACDYTYHGHITGSFGPLKWGNRTEEKWYNCTNSWHVTQETSGEMTVEHTSGYNGTLISNGALIKTTRFFVPCNYETKNTHFGTFTGGSPATMHINANLPVAAGSSELCGTGTAKMSGNLVVTSPSSLYVDG